MLDRLKLDPARLAGIADAVEQVAGLPDLVGQVIDYIQERFLNRANNPNLPPGLDLRLDKALPVGLLELIIGVGRAP